MDNKDYYVKSKKSDTPTKTIMEVISETILFPSSKIPSKMRGGEFF